MSRTMSRATLVQTHDEGGAQYNKPERTDHRTVLGAKRAARKAGDHRARIEQDGEPVWFLAHGRWVEARS